MRVWSSQLRRRFLRLAAVLTICFGLILINGATASATSQIINVSLLSQTWSGVTWQGGQWVGLPSITEISSLCSAPGTPGSSFDLGTIPQPAEGQISAVYALRVLSNGDEAEPVAGIEQPFLSLESAGSTGGLPEDHCEILFFAVGRGWVGPFYAGEFTGDVSWTINIQDDGTPPPQVVLQSVPVHAFIGPPPMVVSLGDSYSSGEGNPPFDPGTDVFKGKKRLDGCHRSADAWPRLLGVLSSNHLACSGAVINNIFNGQERIAPDNVPQLARLRAIERSLEAQGRHIDVVTLTLGGNDFGFGSTIADCFFFNGCLKNIDKEIKRVRALRTPLDSAVAAIRVAAPFAKVLLVGYPRIFPSAQSGNVTCGWLTPIERERANTIAAWFDVVDAQVAHDSGAEFVSVANALDGHELCTADSWMFEVNPLIWGRDQRQGHPLFPGQQAIASVVAPHL